MYFSAKKTTVGQSTRVRVPGREVREGPRDGPRVRVGAVIEQQQRHLQQAKVGRSHERGEAVAGGGQVLEKVKEMTSCSLQVLVST